MKFIRFVFWILAVLILVLVGDQVLMRYTFEAPGVVPAQRFYRDFRQRLLTLQQPGDEADDIGRTIEEQAAPPQKKQHGRYVYADDTGTLHFADSLAEVPAAYRSSAQPMDD